MKRIKIDSLDKLETFVKNEAVSIEDRLQVFEQALNSYPFFVIALKYDDTCIKIENVEAVAGQMIRVVQDIRQAPNNKYYTGFSVLYEHN
jgi:hypothetical protein